MSSPPKRLLVTGSRFFTDRKTVEYALYRARYALGGGDIVLVHGECHLGGADIMARDLWRNAGLRDEPHPVDHAKHGPWPMAGPIRNAEMVKAGADLCLAFYQEGEKNTGTKNCSTLARGVGIKVIDYWNGAVL